jgi:carotenoid cleavage dioxygenase
MDAAARRATLAGGDGTVVLEGQFRPVREEVTVVDLKVSGEIPDHLDGRYVRIGPNPLAEVDPATYHWFSGDGMAHGVRIRDGRAEWYRNRWIRTRAISRALGERPRPGRAHAGMDYAVNTNIVSQAGRTFAIVEGGVRGYELTSELETVAVCDFDGTLAGGYAAHPHRDPDTGELHAVSYFWGWGNRVRYSVLTREARIRRMVDIEVTGSPMMHDFSLTENYVILYDLPFTFDASLVTRDMPAWAGRPTRSVLSRVVGRMPIPERIVTAATRLGSRLSTSGLGIPYSWNPDYPARIGVLPRTGGPDAIRWFDIEPCFVCHPLNAYERPAGNGTGAETGIVLDVVRHPRMFATSSVPGEGGSTLDRWTIDLASGKVTQDRLDDHHQEFPRRDERVEGRPHRYGYAIGLGATDEIDDPSARGPNFDTLLKHDLHAGRTATRVFDPAKTLGEFTFVPHATDAAEDDGVLMGYVHDAHTDRSDLLLLDAQTLDTVATIHLPVRVPGGFHGNWLPA